MESPTFLFVNFIKKYVYKICKLNFNDQLMKQFQVQMNKKIDTYSKYSDFQCYFQSFSASARLLLTSCNTEIKIKVFKPCTKHKICFQKSSTKAVLVIMCINRL